MNACLEMFLRPLAHSSDDFCKCHMALFVYAGLLCFVHDSENKHTVSTNTTVLKFQAFFLMKMVIYIFSSEFTQHTVGCSEFPVKRDYCDT